MFAEILEDALFAAIAAIGFSAISNPPRNAYYYCAAIAAAGHSLRFVLMHYTDGIFSIIPASFVAALVVGVLAVLLSPHAKTPAETFLFPSLLPMIPGIYAYKTFGGLVMCVLHSGENEFLHYLYLFSYNGLTCLFIIVVMVVGATIPIFVFKKVSFRATRQDGCDGKID
ncbi:MAG: threonine/serine exporter family protein [Duncaniella sp.]|nr:threonine/serine exporter family protein [Duncaniella sp.]